MRGSTTQPPALAGTVAPAVHVTHGPIRRALTYPFAAARANRALTVAVAASVIGASALLWWSTPRLWRVDAIVLAAAPPGHSATIAPNDLSKLLESAPLQEAAIDAVAGSVELQPWGRWDRLRAAASKIRSRIVATFNSADQPVVQTPPTPLRNLVRIETRPPSDGGAAVGIRVLAPSPHVAESLPAQLLHVARENRRQAERERVALRLESIRPELETAQQTFQDAEDAIQQFREHIGRHDPATHVQSLEQAIADAQAQQAAIQTQTREINALWSEVSAQLNEGLEEQTRSVVVERNPRVIELQGRISDLTAEYESLISLQPTHPRKLSIASEIEALKRELDAQVQTIVREEITGPDPVRDRLRERQTDLNAQLSQLAAREIGLAEQIEQLTASLRHASDQARRMESLQQERDRARDRWNELADEVSALEAVAADTSLFEYLRLAEPPRVRSADVPDSPNTRAWIAVTILLALALALIAAVARSAWRRRLVAAWQVDTLTSTLPVRVLAELPDASPRRLLGPVSGR